MLNKLLSKLIKNSAGKTRFLMALVGMSVAIFLILSAVQLQVNYYQLLHAKDNQDSIANFLVVNKIMTDQNIGSSSLSEAQIKDIQEQPFVESVGNIIPSRFKAAIQSNSSRFPFYTDIAFESVPAEFLDITPKDWDWNEQSNYLPIIVPNQFLDIYNFQFSISQNLPQLTPAIVKMLVFRVTIQTAAGPLNMNGRVVGLSNRISSMLVPQSFMEWANRRFANNLGTNASSRVVIRTKDPGNPLLVKYLKEKGLTTDADKTRFSRYRQVVDFVVNISGISGILLLAFALLIFTLFIQLTIASCKDEISLLVLMGSSPKQLKLFLMLRFFPPNIWIVLIGLFLIGATQFWLCHFLETKQIFLSPFISGYTVIAAICILLVIAYVNEQSIRKWLRQKR
jgi:hypothetical protein